MCPFTHFPLHEDAIQLHFRDEEDLLNGGANHVYAMHKSKFGSCCEENSCLSVLICDLKAFRDEIFNKLTEIIHEGNAAI